MPFHGVSFGLQEPQKSVLVFQVPQDALLAMIKHTERSFKSSHPSPAAGVPSRLPCQQRQYKHISQNSTDGTQRGDRITCMEAESTGREITGAWDKDSLSGWEASEEDAGLIPILKWLMQAYSASGRVSAFVFQFYSYSERPCRRFKPFDQTVQENWHVRNEMKFVHILRYK